MERANVGGVDRLLSAGAGLALLLAGGSRRETPGGKAAMAAGVLLGLRAATGRSLLYRLLGVTSAHLDEGAGITFDATVTVDRPPDEVYAAWRDLSCAPLFMREVESVEPVGENRTHWTMKGPRGLRMEWDAEVVERRAGEFVSWRSLPGSDLEHAGSVHFTALPDGGTLVRLRMRYRPPGGPLGFGLARLSRGVNERQVREDLRNLKALLEAGEVATTAGQSTGPRSKRRARAEEALR